MFVFRSRQKRISVQVRVKLKNKEIEQVKENAFLGVVLDEHLTWRLMLPKWKNLQTKFLPEERVSSYFILF